MKILIELGEGKNKVTDEAGNLLPVHDLNVHVTAKDQDVVSAKCQMYLNNLKTVSPIEADVTVVELPSGNRFKLVPCD